MNTSRRVTNQGSAEVIGSSSAGVTARGRPVAFFQPRHLPNNGHSFTNHGVRGVGAHVEVDVKRFATAPAMQEAWPSGGITGNEPPHRASRPTAQDHCRES